MIGRMKFVDLCESIKNVAEARSRIWDGHRMDEELTEHLVDADDNLGFTIRMLANEIRSRL